MNRVEGYIAAHIGDGINECDDNFSVSFDKCGFAVADGSSSDFFSKIYSRLLVDAFIEDASEMFEEGRIKGLNDKWRLLVREKLDRAGCKPGSFPFVRFQKMDPGCSTLIGLKLFNAGGLAKFRCSGIGDSVLFFIPEGESIPTIQFSSDSNKGFSLDQDVNFGYTPVLAISYSTQWLDKVISLEGVLEKGIFFLMTDGLAEWILRKDNGSIVDKFKTLKSIQSQEEFILYVNSIRNSGAHNDDMTLVKIHIDSLQLEFDESESVIFDYRTEQKRIEIEEDEKRLSIVKASTPKVQAKPASSVNTTSDLIATAMSKVYEQNKLKKEQIEGRNATQSLIDATRAKITSVSAQKDVQNTDGITTATIKERREKHGDAEKEDALTDADAKIRRIEEGMKKEQDDIEKTQPGDKKIINRICESPKGMFCCVLLLISSMLILHLFSGGKNDDSFQELEDRIANLQQQHSSDSIKIQELETENRELLKQNGELMQSTSLYNRRMEYLQAWPYVYKQILKVK